MTHKPLGRWPKAAALPERPRAAAIPREKQKSINENDDDDENMFSLF